MDTKLKELKLESDKLRKAIIELAARDGGHVGPPLGAVEVIQALLQVYDFTKDKMLFDVGHQMHAYKILTDRATKIHMMDKKGGIGEFPNIHESPFDFYTGGHSGLAISAALGYAINHDGYKSIALIGDGSMTGGQPYEALNQAGELQPNLLVIYNDNGYSITENTGFLHAKKRVRQFSESLGFEYVGIVDGHDLEGLIKTLSEIKGKRYPIFLHIKTIKGKGYQPAEDDPVAFHSVAPFDIATGKPKETKSNSFGDLIIKKTKNYKKKHNNLYLVTPAAARSSGLKELKKLYPETVIDTGMNEQHCVTFSAALALNGNKVICFIPAIFMPRALDQIIDVSLLHVPVVFVLLNPGIAGTGPTHQGIYTIPMLNMLPNVELFNPANLMEFDVLLDDALKAQGPVFIQKPAENIQVGKYEEDVSEVRSGDRLTVLAVGNMLGKAVHLAETFEGVQVLYLRKVKPTNVDKIAAYVSQTHKLLILEDGCVHSGIGQHIVANLPQGLLSNFEILGVKDVYPPLGSLEDVYKAVGVDDAKVLKVARDMLSQTSEKPKQI